jgi:hypothetical protein
MFSPDKGRGRTLNEVKGTEGGSPLHILLYPRFCVRHPVKDEEVVKPDFEKQIMKGFKLLQPFNDFLGEVLY